MHNIAHITLIYLFLQHVSADRHLQGSVNQLLYITFRTLKCDVGADFNIILKSYNSYNTSVFLRGYFRFVVLPSSTYSQ
jgi:hypothetical protein